jgi:hypothetical protein
VTATKAVPKKAAPKKAAPKAATVTAESYANPGDRVWYQRDAHPHMEDQRKRLGYGEVLYEWLALDVVAVKVRNDAGAEFNLFPALGDRIKVVVTGDEEPDA